MSAKSSISCLVMPTSDKARGVLKRWPAGGAGRRHRARIAREQLHRGTGCNRQRIENRERLPRRQRAVIFAAARPQQGTSSGALKWPTAPNIAIFRQISSMFTGSSDGRRGTGGVTRIALAHSADGCRACPSGPGDRLHPGWTRVTQGARAWPATRLGALATPPRLHTPAAGYGEHPICGSSAPSATARSQLACLSPSEVFRHGLAVGPAGPINSRR
jgi:hypothetical protein